jgi:predicted chitinase
METARQEKILAGFYFKTVNGETKMENDEVGGVIKKAKGLGLRGIEPRFLRTV